MNGRLIPRAIGTLLVAVIASAVIGIASLPTGAAAPSGLVPATARLAEQTSVGDVRVLLLSDVSGLRILFAYRGAKGWLPVETGAVSASSNAAWTSTPGGGALPSLSVAYGQVPLTSATGAVVHVTWADGVVASGAVGSDGTWLLARRGVVRSQTVLVTDSSGRTLSRLAGP